MIHCGPAGIHAQTAGTLHESTPPRRAISAQARNFGSAIPFWIEFGRWGWENGRRRQKARRKGAKEKMARGRTKEERAGAVGKAGGTREYYGATTRRTGARGRAGRQGKGEI